MTDQLLRAVRNDKGNVVGQIVLGTDIDGEHYIALQKQVKLANQLRTPPAWATDTNHIQALRTIPYPEDCKRLTILKDDKGALWIARLETWNKYGFVLFRGHGEQLGLELKRWDRIMPSGDASSLTDSDMPIQTALQSRLDM